MAIRVAIVGATGYTALESIRWLLKHPRARITFLASRQQGLTISQQFPELLGRMDLPIRPIDAAAIAAEADVALVCLPHVSAMEHVPGLLAHGLKVVDLSADYRLKDSAIYQQWYKHEHADAHNLSHAVYGLTEFFAPQIAAARLVANPGCYATAAALGIAPFLANGFAAAEGIVVNAASGISGAGRKPSQTHHFPERNETFEAYAIGAHRHQPEIQQTLACLTGRQAQVLFVPHLLPMDRGILATIYLRTSRDVSTADAQGALAAYYKNKRFVRVRLDCQPSTKYVANTNFVDIAVTRAQDFLVITVALDNMVKGASGQAIQNMNVMFGLPEETGLLA